VEKSQLVVALVLVVIVNVAIGVVTRKARYYITDTRNIMLIIYHLLIDDKGEKRNRDGKNNRDSNREAGNISK
jgi:hypothetical protein